MNPQRPGYDLLIYGFTYLPPTREGAMRTLLQVLSEDQRAQVHERTLSVLARPACEWTPPRVARFSRKPGPRSTGTPASCASRERWSRSRSDRPPRTSPWGARRPGWDLRMNSGDCTLLIDGQAVFALDRETGERRAGTFNDWLEATRLTDALDEFGLYWDMIERSDCGKTVADLVTHWRHLFRNFSKHIQDGISVREQAPWLLEVLQVVFGDKETIRRQHPWSCIVVPAVAADHRRKEHRCLPGASGLGHTPGSHADAADGCLGPRQPDLHHGAGQLRGAGHALPGAGRRAGHPIHIRPGQSMMNPRSGGYSAGAIEGGLLAAAAVEMARHYGLPVEASGMTTDHYVPGIQSCL